MSKSEGVEVGTDSVAPRVLIDIVPSQADISVAEEESGIHRTGRVADAATSVVKQVVALQSSAFGDVGAVIGGIAKDIHEAVADIFAGSDRPELLVEFGITLTGESDVKLVSVSGGSVYKLTRAYTRRDETVSSSGFYERISLVRDGDVLGPDERQGAIEREPTRQL